MRANRDYAVNREQATTPRRLFGFGDSPLTIRA
jgi:hypothetical protein